MLEMCFVKVHEIIAIDAELQKFLAKSLDTCWTKQSMPAPPESVQGQSWIARRLAR